MMWEEREQIKIHIVDMSQFRIWILWSLRFLICWNRVNEACPVWEGPVESALFSWLWTIRPLIDDCLHSTAFRRLMTKTPLKWRRKLSCDRLHGKGSARNPSCLFTDYWARRKRGADGLKHGDAASQSTGTWHFWRGGADRSQTIDAIETQVSLWRSTRQ